MPLLFVGFFAGCTDQGCIEADDFGEYQTQTLEVNSNATQDSCKYDSLLPLSDASQGSGVKTCFTSGSVQISNEAGSTQYGNGGCNGSRTNNAGAYVDANGTVLNNQSDPSLRVKMDAQFISLCVSSCVNTCLSGSSSSGSQANPEPNWIATDNRDSSRNSGVQILPGSQISITASGAVTLSNSAIYPAAFIPVSTLNSNGVQENFKNSTWNDELLFDVTLGQSFNVKFSGLWQRPPSGSISPPTYYYNTNAMGGGATALATSSPWNTSIHNGAISLVAYTIPHPTGYSFDSSQTNEKAATKGVPLLPDPSVWTCLYDPNAASVRGAVVESDCSNKSNGYGTVGYISAVDTAVRQNNDFKQISYTAGGNPPPALGTYGGLIRWGGDNLRDATYDPSLPAYTASFGTNYPLSQDYNSGVIASSTAIDITNSNSYAEAISFRASCGGSVGTPITATVKNSDGSIAKTSFPINLKSAFPNTKNSSGATNFVTLEPGQLISISIAAQSPCENQTIEWRFHKYLDIPIARSGFVKFTTLNGFSGNCSLNGRIINKNNKNGSVRNGNDSDFYEYDDFYTASSKDPLDAISVPISSSSNMSWSNKVFVRKGQIIRLSPVSWNGTVSVNSTSGTSIARQCGIGMAMYITPRPALLCKGIAHVASPSHDNRCLPDTDLNTGNLIGCQAYSAECSNSGNRAYYCPNPACQSTITCTPGNATNNYTKTGCVATDNTNTAACNNALTSLSATDITAMKTACGNSKCGASMLAAAQLVAMPRLTVDQCYDLENYTGRASDIPFANGSAVASDDAIFSKGAAILGDFNGYYGNFSNFKDTGKTENAATNSNRIYQANNILTFAQNSRLKFLILTNDGDFRKLDQNYSSTRTTLSTEYPYSTLTPKGTSYNGTNGMKVNFEGSLQFTNGQWLEARLCRETSSHSCRGSTLPYSSSDPYDVAINAQPHLIELNSSSGSSGTPNIAASSNYIFDAFGTLIRTTAPGAKDCSIANQAIDTQIGSPFYCHSYLNSTTSYIYDANATQKFSDSQYDELKQLRLTFKIKDPENPNCIIPGSGSTTYNGITLPNPAYQSNVCYTGSNCIATSTSYRSNCGANYSEACTGYISSGSCVSPSQSQYNGYYSSSNTCSSNVATVGQTCNASDGSPSLSASNPCRKQFYCASPYANNSGKYYVTVKVANPPGNNISNIIGGVITPVIEVMDGKRSIDARGNVTQTVGQSQRIYTLLVSDNRYQAILSISMAMMLMFFGVTYLMGITDLSSSDLINRCIKIAMIYFFASPTGWYWFNMFAVKWFKDGTDYLAFMMASSFDDSPSLAKAISLNDYYDKSVLFSSVDKVFGMFFSQAVQKKISALLFASIFGFVYLWIIYLSFFLYIYAVSYAVLYYLTAQIFISILFTLGPIFFIFTLFNQTKGMFDSWLKQLIGFSMQQILLLTTLAFFNMMMYEVVKMSLGYKICWDEVWTINIITRISLLSFWTVASLPPSVNTQTEVGDIGHPEGIPSLFSILFIWVIASLMRNFVDFMTNLGASIAGGLKASEMAKGISGAMEAAYKTSSKQFEDITKGMVGEPMKRLDAALFDSGEHAERDRKQRQDKNRQDQGKKDSLSKAGNEAMSQYKRDNAEAYSKMDETDKKAALLKAKDDGMKNEAKKLGIDDKELARLKSDKGFKYEGSNLLVAAAQAARQKAGYGGGTLNKSLNESNVDTKMSFNEAAAGMKKMNQGQRDDFEKRAAEGQVKVGRSTSQKIIGAAQSAVSPATGTLQASGGLAKDVFSASRAGLSAVTGRDFGGNADFKSTTKNLNAAKQSAGSVKDALKSNASKVMGKAKNAVGAGDYDEARKQLEQSGEIKRMSPLTNWARSDDEKQKIQQRMRQNREAKKFEMPTVNNNVTLSKLSSLNKGLTKDEGNKTFTTAVSSAIFGAGGLSNAVSAQTDKFKSADKYSATSMVSASNKLSTDLSSANTQKNKLTGIRDNAQKASANIKSVNELEQKQKDAKNPAERKDIAEKLAAVMTADRRENGGSGYYQDKEAMEKHRAAYQAATTDQDKAAIKTQMDAITGKEGYIESDGGGLNRANAIYQKSNQDIQSLDLRIGQMSPTGNALQKTATTFNAVMGSNNATQIAKDYNQKVGTFAKVTGGLFSAADTKKVIKDHKKLESFKKDYANLKTMGGNRDLNIRKTGAIGKLFGQKNSLEGTNKAAARHDDFMKKHESFITDSGVAPREDPDYDPPVDNPLHRKS